MAKKENSLKGLRNKGKKLLTGANWSKRKEQSDLGSVDHLFLLDYATSTCVDYLSKLKKEDKEQDWPKLQPGFEYVIKHLKHLKKYTNLELARIKS